MSVKSLADATDWAAAAFARHGASKANARSVARALIAAEADGLKGHGLSRVPTYLGMLRSGKIDGGATPRASRPKPGVLAIDAAFGFAYPAIDLALERLPSLAHEQGVVAAPISRSNHCGAAGLPCEHLARLGLVALLFANTPGAIAPWGGSKPVFGTNPIAFAAPLADRDPVVVDLAVSKVARGPIVAANQKGERIPDGWALDSSGQPTTDAAAALAGTMLPLGDAKGAALALMVEVLAACLVGANLAFEASSFLDGSGRRPRRVSSCLRSIPRRSVTIVLENASARLPPPSKRSPARVCPEFARLALRARAAKRASFIPPEVEAAVAKFG